MIFLLVLVILTLNITQTDIIIPESSNLAKDTVGSHRTYLDKFYEFSKIKGNGIS